MNNKIDLSICIPSIRTINWPQIYQSIKDSIGSYTFELIFCGPEKNNSLKEDNVHWIEDFGSACRAQQLSCLEAKGEYIMWAPDDGVFLKDGLKTCLDELNLMAEPLEKAIITKYSEAGRDGLADSAQDKTNIEQITACYKCGYHEPLRSRFYSGEYWIFNCAIMKTQYWRKLGGFDCVSFEGTTMAHADLGIRFQLDGCGEIKFLNIQLLKCSHLPGETGDHGPIHNGQIQNDQPNFKKIYSNPECLERIIELDNWKNSPKIWERRFGNDKI